jgi:hypothetical protein
MHGLPRLHQPFHDTNANSDGDAVLFFLPASRKLFVRGKVAPALLFDIPFAEMFTTCMQG